MKYVGAHVSAAGGVENAPLNAHRIGAKAFAFFTKNQRQWFAAPYTEKNIELFKARCNEFGYSPDHILPHDSYLINLGLPLRNTSVHAKTSSKAMKMHITTATSNATRATQPNISGIFLTANPFRESNSNTK